MAHAERPALNAFRPLAGRRRSSWLQALVVGVGATLIGTATGANAPARSAPSPQAPLAQTSAPSLGGAAPAQPGATNLAEASGADQSASTPDQLALVEILRRKGVVFYGAWWCGHCAHQKRLFGAEAASKLPYVECDKDDPGRQRCQTAKIRAFPTWDYKGERREGVLELEELRVWVGVPNGSASRAAKGSQT
jgi:hypothetical protein